MKAILLSAGLGTRLRPLTNKIPKCLVPINGKPLLEIWLENLINSGIEDVLINTHYLPNMVSSFISKSKYKENCKLVFEKELLGTAGTLLNNLDFIGKDDCLLIHSDNYCIESLNYLILAHKKRPKKCLMTMMTFRADDPASCGIVELNEKSIVVNFHEKIENPPSELANGAVYVLSQNFIEEINKSNKYATDFSLEIISNYLGKIFSYETKEIFIDIGTPKSYEKANSLDILK